MPELGYLGSLSRLYLNYSEYDYLSVTYSIVLGSQMWSFKSGQNCGESSQIQGFQGYDSNTIGSPIPVDQPIDFTLETQSIEGWPKIVVEIWSRPSPQIHELIGCGVLWLPTKSGIFDIPLWKPRETEDVKEIRRLLLHPYKRNSIEGDSIGTLLLDTYVIAKGLSEVGVIL